MIGNIIVPIHATAKGGVEEGAFIGFITGTTTRSIRAVLATVVAGDAISRLKMIIVAYIARTSPIDKCPEGRV